jgi:drug/metabolite transporter (DMT)-like permease
MVSFKRIKEFNPHLSQILVQVAFAGMYIITRVSFIDGMNHFVFVTYRQIIATVSIAPFAYFLERKDRSPLTWLLLLQICLLATGITISQNCYFQGLYYTSSTFASAALNLVPVLTFALATFLRLEKVNMRSLGGQAKVVGTVICVSGAMIMTLYKGPAIKFFSPGAKNHHITYNSKANELVLGTILVFGSVVIMAVCLAFQAPVLKKYPAQLSLTALLCLIGSVQSALIAGICEHKKSKLWAIGWNIELLSVVYAGIICSALGMFLQAWCISKKGPVFVAIFNPVGTIVTAIFEFIILHVYLHVGSVVGATLIAVGLYSALWGKANDTPVEDAEESRHNIILPFEKQEEIA